MTKPEELEEIAKAADPLDPLLIARLEGWVSEMRRSAKAMQDAGLNDVAAGNLNVARDIEGGLRRLYALLSERSTSMERIRELEEALEPFAEAVDNLDDDYPDKGSLWESAAAADLDAGQLRRARAALQHRDRSK